MPDVRLDGTSLTLADVVRVARHGATVALDAAARERMRASHAWVESAAAGTDAIYGVNTGYGSLARVRIDRDRIQQLSWNLVRSHAAGVGPSLADDVVRAMMLLRANSLAKGASGCRPALVDTLCAMLDAGVTPVVPSRGSCGSSGDLAPLAHLGLVMFGTGDESGTARVNGVEQRGADAMATAGIPRLDPGPKEGLAITNGAQLCAALGALACYDAEQLVLHAEIAAAMSWEAMLGVTRALHPAVHALRPYPGAIACAANLRALLEGSALVDSTDKLQDAYSLRCTPQVLGAVRDGIAFATTQIRIEVNAVTDNPVILLETGSSNHAFSAGLFHGEPVGMATDHLKLALCELGALAERRIFRLTTGSLSARLPALLAGEDLPGMGLMVPHTTAAALVSENRSLAWPNTADSIPTCEDQEDLVAMSTSAARRCAEVLVNTRRIVAIELMSAAHALWWRRRQGHGTGAVGTSAALDALEEVLDGHWGQTPAEDIGRIEAAITSGALLDAVQAVTPLQGVP